jgi:hypothetical protein
VTTKGLIGCIFEPDGEIKGMFVNADGHAGGMKMTVISNMLINEWSLERTMKRIYEEEFFYFSFTRRDFRLPTVYMDFAEKMRYLDFHEFEYIIRQDALKNNQYQDIFSPSTPQCRGDVISWYIKMSYLGHDKATCFQVLANTAPEGASMSIEMQNWLKEELDDFNQDDRMCINNNGLPLFDYTVVFDVPNQTVSHWDYDDESGENWRTWTVQELISDEGQS